MDSQSVDQVMSAHDMAVNALFGLHGESEIQQVLVELAVELIVSTRAYDPGLDCHHYGRPRLGERVGSPWAEADGSPDELYYTATMARGGGTKAAVKGALVHASWLAIMLKVILENISNANHVSGHDMRKYRAGQVEMHKNQFQRKTSRLIATVSNLVGQQVTGWEIGLSSVDNTMFFSDACRLTLSTGTTGNMELALHQLERLEHIEVAAAGVSWLIVTEKRCIANDITMGRHSIFTQGLGGGIVLSCSGVPTLRDLKWVKFFSLAFPAAPIFAVFDLDCAGVNSIVTLRRGLLNSGNFPEYRALTLGDERVKWAGLTPAQLQSAKAHAKGKVLSGRDVNELKRLKGRLPESEAPCIDTLLAGGRKFTLEDVGEVNATTVLLDLLATEIRSYNLKPSTYVNVCRPRAAPLCHHPDIVDKLHRVATFWGDKRREFEEHGTRPQPMSRLKSLAGQVNGKRRRTTESEAPASDTSARSDPHGIHWSWSQQLERDIGVTQAQAELELGGVNEAVAATACAVAFGEGLKTHSTVFDHTLVAARKWLEETCGEGVNEVLAVARNLVGESRSR